MTREEFVARYRHELAGIVLDGTIARRSGGELSLWLATAMQAIDARLGQMYDQLQPPPPAPKPPVSNGATNGHPKTPGIIAHRPDAR